MGFFSSIKDAIFGKKAEAATPAPVEAAPVAVAAPAPVDVAAVLGAMQGADGLNWQGSIVDLMKLVGIDASFANRMELAHELGDADYSGTAEENIALHKAVMKGLAENGGNVPASMLD
jgi:hypothetical protein